MTNDDPNRSHRRADVHASGVMLGGVLLSAILTLAVGCASVPAVSQSEQVDARTLYAETPVEWQSQARACLDAGRRAKLAARRTCDLASLTVPKTACECRPSAVTAGTWRCTASATYTCAGESLVAGGPE